MSRLWKVAAHWYGVRRSCLSGLADCLGKIVCSGGLSKGTAWFDGMAGGLLISTGLVDDGSLKNC